MGELNNSTQLLKATLLITLFIQETLNSGYTGRENG